MSGQAYGPPSCHCATCADEGVPMRVLREPAGVGLTECAAADGATTTVDTTLVAPVAIGERVLVHAGVALVKLDEAAGPAGAEAAP